MTKNLRERFYIKLRYLYCPHCECVTDLMKLYFLQSVPLEETGEKLPVSSRLGRLCLSSQEIVVRVV